MPTKRGPSPPQDYKYPGNNSSDTIEEFSSTASPSPPSLKNLKRVLLQFKRAARGVSNAAQPQSKKRKKKKSKEIVIKFIMKNAKTYSYFYRNFVRRYV